MLDAGLTITEFAETVTLAGLKPRDVASIVGMHETSLYKIIAGRTRTSRLAINHLACVTKFLRHAMKEGMLTGSAPSVKGPVPEPKIDLDQLFQIWLTHH